MLDIPHGMLKETRTMCATHDPEAQGKIAQQNLAAAIWLAVSDRLQKDETVPVRSFIYDAVVEAIGKCGRVLYGPAEPVFEDDFVEAAVLLLYHEPNKQYLGFVDALTATTRLVWSRPISQEAADAYMEVREERSQALALKWLETACQFVPTPVSDGMQLCLVPLKLVMGQPLAEVTAGTKKPTLSFASDLLAAPAQQAMRCFGYACYEGRPGDKDFRRIATMVSALGVGATWALGRYRHQLEHHGDPVDTLGGRDSTKSEAIKRAFERSAQADPSQLARSWLQRSFDYEAASMDVTTLTAAFVSFQQALGLGAGEFDYCHYGIIPRGLRHCLLSPRLPGLLDLLPSVAAKVTRPKTCKVFPDSERYAVEVAERVRGADEWKAIRIVQDENLSLRTQPITVKIDKHGDLAIEPFWKENIPC